MMNRIDRENLSVMTESVNSSSPIGLNTATGSPNLGVPASRPAATVADDSTVANSSNVIEPKPSVKFALPENYGTVPVNMNSHGDYTGPGLAPRPSRSEHSSPQQSQVIEPKPGAKFALPEDFGTFPVNRHGDYTGEGLEPRPGNRGQSNAQQDPVIEPKPGSKFALPEEDECGAMPVPLVHEQVGSQPNGQQHQPVPSEQPRSAASVPDDLSIPNSGDILTPKPGSKFAAAQLQR